MSDYPDFARLLNNHLAEQDRSMSWLAKRLGVSPATVTRWSQGSRPGDPETVLRIADVLNVYDATARQALLVACGYGVRGIVPAPALPYPAFETLHSRIYQLYRRSVQYTWSNNRQAWDGHWEDERIFTCVAQHVERLRISRVQPESPYFPFLPTTDYQIELTTSDRTYPGRIVLEPPYRKKERNFAFRVKFVPALRPSEQVHVRVRYVLPQEKISNQAKLLSMALAENASARNYEFKNLIVEYPMEQLVYTMHLPPRSGAIPQDIEVLLWRINFPEEQQYIQAHNSFTITGSDEAGWQMRLERQHPPLKAEYRIKWTLPPTVPDLD